MMTEFYAQMFYIVYSILKQITIIILLYNIIKLIQK